QYGDSSENLKWNHLLSDCGLICISLLCTCHNYFALQVGKMGLKCRIIPPAVTGSPKFERMFRAQQDCVELYPVFLITLWMAGWYFNEVFAAILGLVYIYGRHKYFWGYAEATERRMSGLELSLRTLSLLTVLSGLGIAYCWTSYHQEPEVALL
uniref:Microsomal glutathione S-transferase 2 n=1 Tax=Ictidomys tridecemlineatus TaxID=43179 RepID=I3M482_ICTTR